MFSRPTRTPALVARALGAVALLATACGRGASTPVPPAERTAAVGVDDFGDTVRVPAAGRAPARVVSLNPTTTELLFALGAGRRLVGRTHWDLYPDSARRVPDLGDGIRPNVEGVLAARPDLVVMYAGADNRDAARALRAAGVPVVALKIDRVDQFARAARLLGRVAGDSARGVTVADSVLATLARVRAATKALPRPRAFWPFGGEPLYVAGGGSYLTELLDAAGAGNAFGDLPQPAPQVSPEQVLARGADVVLGTPEATARIRTEPRWRTLAAVRAGRVLAVDTALVLRPGVRLGAAAASLAELLHPGSLAGTGVTAPRPR